jgi:hypothetical protein
MVLFVRHPTWAEVELEMEEVLRNGRPRSRSPVAPARNMRPRQPSYPPPPGTYLRLSLQQFEFNPEAVQGEQQ